MSYNTPDGPANTTDPMSPDYDDSYDECEELTAEEIYDAAV